MAEAAQQAAQERSRRRTELVTRLIALLDRVRAHGKDPNEWQKEMDAIIAELAVLNAANQEEVVRPRSDLGRAARA